MIEALFIGLAVVDWVVAVVLVRGWATLAVPSSRKRALLDRAGAAVVAALAASIVVAFIVIRVGGGQVPSDVRAALGFVVVILISAPSVRWLLAYLRGDFR